MRAAECRVSDYDTFELGDYELQSGATIPGAKLAYKTHGTLAPDRSNVVVLPTAYGGTHSDYEWLIKPGRALDPERWFTVAINKFGNGLSTSPSTTPPEARASWPDVVTIYDNVMAQHRLVTECFGVVRVALVAGFSMGALQAFAWGALYGDDVERIAPYCGAARCAPHNWVFLDGIEAAITADAAWNGGAYGAQPVTGLRAAGRVWAGWGHSQTFYREERWREMGFKTRDAFIERVWIRTFASADTNNLLAMIHTWKSADLAAHPKFNGDYEAALGAITARALVMPCATDLYFPPEDCEIAVRAMRNAELVVIPSVWGHTAGGNLNRTDSAYIDEHLLRLLA